MMKHIILDTDIGRNPDDLFALFLALNSKEIKLDLIISSDEHKNHKALFANGFSELINKKVNVTAGKDLGNENDCFVCEYIDEDNKINYDFLESIIKVVKSNDVTYYLCIGPLSNLADFIKNNQHLKDKIKIIVMGGKIELNKGTADRNIRQDVASAKLVFGSNWDIKWVIADTTFNDALKLDLHNELYSYLMEVDNMKSRLIIKNINNYIKFTGKPSYLHDPAVVAYLIDEKIIEFEHKNIIMLDNGEFRIDSSGKLISISYFMDYTRINELVFNIIKQNFKIKEKKEVYEDEFEG